MARGPRSRGDVRPQTADPHTGQVDAAPGISIPHAGHVFVPPAGGARAPWIGAAAGGAGAGSFFRRRIRRNSRTSTIATMIPMRRPRYTPNSSRKVTSLQPARSVFTSFIVTCTDVDCPDPSPDQPVKTYFVPPSWNGEVTVTVAVEPDSYQQPSCWVPAEFTQVHAGCGESIVRRNCFLYVAVRVAA